MGRLDCKTPTLFALNILTGTADEFVTISDSQAENAVQAAKITGLNTSLPGADGIAALLANSIVHSSSLIIATKAAVSKSNYV